MFETLTAKDWLSAGSQVLSGVLGGGKPAGPSSVLASTDTRTATTNESWFDGSGWTVATGSGSARGGDRSQSDGTGLASPWTLAAGLVGLLVVAVVAKAWKA